MSEQWDPAEHRLTYRVWTSPEDHVVYVCTVPYYVSSVTLRYTRVAGPDSEWAPPDIGVMASGRRWTRDQLDSVPQWLLDIEARAQPMDP